MSKTSLSSVWAGGNRDICHFIHFQKPADYFNVAVGINFEV